ncbi:hypothetical protein [Mucilaginibacter sp. FT3.2]|uniref:hypothetical protein n=1 Tax=Mucilaginibacter sp. FT3.2 TaxID=2723090 RepID=UPI00160BB943|nr:hypothetical protein [Mucilaginibacter sp. FT3.2]MBB6231065.1 membrane-associated HD superfamily phosphohydrolase [Mucilaginibacter sp. FT3.2]
MDFNKTVEALATLLIILFGLLPYLWLFYKEVNLRIRLLMASVTMFGIFAVLWIAVYWGWESIALVAYGYSGGMWIIFMINFSIIIVSWVISILAKWF